ncbi:MAG TPA: hypothetical protein VK281_05120 [Xanthobacteraceae bacterium]|nr:hypothetical protein [Xanthobacteraceae bacterium]
MPKLGTVSLAGLSGRSYELDVYPRADQFKSLGAVFVLAKRIPFAEREAEYTWIHVGETADMAQRPLAPSLKPCIDEHDANCLCLLVEQDPARRLAIAADLRGGCKPPCE